MKKRFYDLFKARTSNRIFILIIGGRGLGKSFSLKDVFVRDFLNEGKQFIYIRRYATELDITFENYFNDISKKYPDHKFEAVGGKIRMFLIDGEIAGYACSVTEFKYFKSIDLSNVYNLGFDEFLPDDGRYIRRAGNQYFEVDQCFSFYQTVARGFNTPFRAGVRFYFIANAVDFNNPYFQALKIDDLFNRGAKTVKTKSIFAELVNSADYGVIDELKNSQMGDLFGGTRYGDYAFENKFYNDSDNFIVGALPGGVKHLFNILYCDDKYGVWFDNNQGTFYVTEKVDPSSPHNYALTNEAHNVNTVLVEKTKNQPQMKILRDAYNNGFVFFSNTMAKYVLLTFLGLS